MGEEGGLRPRSHPRADRSVAFPEPVVLEAGHVEGEILALEMLKSGSVDEDVALPRPGIFSLRLSRPSVQPFPRVLRRYRYETR